MNVIDIDPMESFQRFTRFEIAAWQPVFLSSTLIMIGCIEMMISAQFSWRMNVTLCQHQHMMCYYYHGLCAVCRRRWK